MSAAKDPQVQLLLVKSAEDESTLQFPVADAIFEFHTQQAIEKLLKALISAHGSDFPFIHDLQVLSDQLKSLGEVFPAFEIPLPAFTKYGVLIRYEYGVSLTLEERQSYKRVVDELRVFVLKRIAELP